MVQFGVESEDGWRPAKVGPDQCVWVTVPGTNVKLQIMRGQPAIILTAAAADFNEFVEPLRDPDSASWTPTNAVATSNHLNATACDWNWNSHAFRVRGTFRPEQVATIREMLDFYEGTLFWAGDWDDPVDEMHWQMGYGSWNNPDTDSFIKRKIRSDGRSTFRRGPLPAKPKEDPAELVLSRATGLPVTRCREILPQVEEGLAGSQCDTPLRIAMWLAQVGQESDSFQATEEYAKNGRYAPYIGRTWIQITWEENYADFSQWCFDRGLVPTASYFVDNPRALADQRWAGLGPAWYWTVQRPQINALCDAGDLVGVTRAINGGTNGLDDRAARYRRALAVGNDLMALTITPGPITLPEEDGFMSALTPDEQRALFNEIMSRHPSRSPLRRLGEGDIGDPMDTEYAIDGNVHILVVELLARLGSPSQIALLEEVANADPVRYPDRQEDAQLAATILDRIYSGDQTLVTRPQVQLPPTPAPVSAPIAAPATTSIGGRIGQLYDALESLQLGSDLPAEAKAPLEALVAVLKSYPKETP